VNNFVNDFFENAKNILHDKMAFFVIYIEQQFKISLWPSSLNGFIIQEMSG